MGRVTFDKDLAREVLRDEAAQPPTDALTRSWIEKVEELSSLCENGVSKTHIAFLGTMMLAKALDHRVNLYAIKPEHARQSETSFSARTLCHSVIVPLAAELGIHLGVTGREPLNNQPYFRMKRLNDETPVHAGGIAAFTYMLRLVRELSAFESEAPARKALRAFIAVRKRYQPNYATNNSEKTLRPERLASTVSTFVRMDSERGRRAQAVAAGLLDVFAGTDRVITGRINDPSREYPGDVCIRSIQDPLVIEKAFEVRDKPVSFEEAQIFGKKCLDLGVREAGLVLVAGTQATIDTFSLSKWASDFGIGVTVFLGWNSFAPQALFWSRLPMTDAVSAAVDRIEARLIEIEASREAVRAWQQLTRGSSLAVL